MVSPIVAWREPWLSDEQYEWLPRFFRLTLPGAARKGGEEYRKWARTQDS